MPLESWGEVDRFLFASTAAFVLDERASSELCGSVAARGHLNHFREACAGLPEEEQDDLVALKGSVLHHEVNGRGDTLLHSIWLQDHFRLPDLAAPLSKLSGGEGAMGFLPAFA